MVHYKPRYRYLFLAALLLSFHYALTVYINSSFLSGYFSEQTINGLYMVGSIITLFALAISSRVLKRYGNYTLVLVGIIAEAVALTTLAFSSNPSTIMLAFIAHQAIPPLLLFGMDIFFEGTLAVARDAEKVRAYYLTFINIAFVAAPLIVAALVSDNSFRVIYILSAVLVSILWFVVADVFRSLTPERYREVGFGDSVRKFVKRKYLSGIFFINFMLQCFFAIMVIFTGPYLHTTIGLSWEAIGVIFTIMLVPFVLFNAPLGKAFDKYHNERDILIVGFLIMSIVLIVISRTTSSNPAVWALLLFLSRVGASFVETAAEAAFFKRMTNQDAGFISIFRMGTPLSYVIAPLVASVLLGFVPVSTMYLLLAIGLIPGIFIAYKTL
jgi:MFS family permease